MTTIVVDRRMGYIAADKMATSNDSEVAIPCDKIREIQKDDGVHLLASSGHESAAAIFEEWYAGDQDEPLEPLEDTEDIDKYTTTILKPDHTIWVADHFYCPYEVKNRWYCHGTGGPFAWAVLEAGCGIKKAMTTALKMDVNSGMGYDVFYLKDYE
jgi:hypothetical protein